MITESTAMIVWMAVAVVGVLVLGYLAGRFSWEPPYAVVILSAMIMWPATLFCVVIATPIVIVFGLPSAGAIWLGRKHRTGKQEK